MTHQVYAQIMRRMTTPIRIQDQKSIFLTSLVSESWWLCSFIEKRLKNYIFMWSITSVAAGSKPRTLGASIPKIIAMWAMTRNIATKRAWSLFLCDSSFPMRFKSESAMPTSDTSKTREGFYPSFCIFCEEEVEFGYGDGFGKDDGYCHKEDQVPRLVAREELHVMSHFHRWKKLYK